MDSDWWCITQNQTHLILTYEYDISLIASTMNQLNLKSFLFGLSFGLWQRILFIDYVQRSSSSLYRILRYRNCLNYITCPECRAIFGQKCLMKVICSWQCLVLAHLLGFYDNVLYTVGVCQKLVHFSFPELVRANSSSLSALSSSFHQNL